MCGTISVNQSPSVCNKHGNKLCNKRVYRLGDGIIVDLNTGLRMAELHTFSVKFIRGLCDNKGIQTKDASGKAYALHSLGGMLVKRPIIVTDKGILTGFKEADWKDLLEG